MKSYISISLLFILIAFTACEDAPPTDYSPRPYVQGYLLVGEPIEDIIVAMSQPIDQPYDYSSSLVSNADVSIEVDGQTIPLVYREQAGVGSYSCPDESIRVLPETSYRLLVRMPGGAVVRAETTTPKIIDWTIQPAASILYPQDTTSMPLSDSLRMVWTPGNNAEYLIRVLALDTLGYGIYLDPSTEEANTRTNSRGEKRGVTYSLTQWVYAPQNRMRLAWNTITWHGRNEITVYAPDYWFLEWFKSVQFSRISAEYDPQESNIIGGLGVFGSASIIRKEVFLQKSGR
ncbi:MAG: DUF4249 family protein [Bacteroidota bacterium]|jgi:hypothetical protein